MCYKIFVCIQFMHTSHLFFFKNINLFRKCWYRLIKCTVSISRIIFKWHKTSCGYTWLLGKTGYYIKMPIWYLSLAIFYITMLISIHWVTAVIFFILDDVFWFSNHSQVHLYSAISIVQSRQSTGEMGLWIFEKRKTLFRIETLAVDIEYWWCYLQIFI